MSVTFSNETFNNSDAAVGAIAAVNVLGLMVDEFAGSPLTGTVGLTTVTVNGTAGAPGSPASISINSPLVQIANGAATYAGFYNNAGDIVYYFNVVGTNIVTGLAATVAVAVSAEALPSLLTATPINTSATTAPLDPNLPGPVFQSASVTGNTVTLGYNEALSCHGPPGDRLHGLVRRRRRHRHERPRCRARTSSSPWRRRWPTDRPSRSATRIPRPATMSAPSRT